MKTLTEHPLIGKTKYLDIQPLGGKQPPMHVDVEVQAVRSLFGRTEALVNPVAGKGQQWIGTERLT